MIAASRCRARSKAAGEQGGLRPGFGEHGGTGAQVPKVLMVSNDFPPRRGGIQSFVHGLASRMPSGAVVVYAPSWDGAAAFDARQPFPVIRHPTSLMLPVPSVARRAVRILREHHTPPAASRGHAGRA